VHPAGGRARAAVGDLWFFGPAAGEVTHVALATGGAGLVHAYGRVQAGSLDPAADHFEAELPGLCRGFVRAPRGGVGIA
jgi:hypothetical protein